MHRPRSGRYASFAPRVPHSSSAAPLTGISLLTTRVSEGDDCREARVERACTEDSVSATRAARRLASHRGRLGNPPPSSPLCAVVSLGHPLRHLRLLR